MNKKVQENITTLHKDISFNGKLVGDEDIIISGRLEGVLQTSQNLTIEKSGIVKADIKSINLVLSGTLVGNVNSKGTVIINKSGRMVGDIKSDKIIINTVNFMKYILTSYSCSIFLLKPENIYFLKIEIWGKFDN